MIESTITIHGFTIAYKSWGDEQLPPLLALHGWQDNANSFDLLAPYLAKYFHLIVIDLPGHGYSSHLPTGCYYHFSDGIFFILQIIKALGWNRYHLLGHSMGACLASLIAGVAPQQILSLGLIEGLGPFSSPAQLCCEQLTRYAELICKKSGRNPKPYPSLDLAIHARAKKGFLAAKYIKILSQRGLKKETDHFYWRHDKRLDLATPLRLTEEQVLSCLQNISAKTCLIWANQGFDFGSESQTRVREKSIKHLEIHRLEGGHHLHMENPEKVAHCLQEFYNRLEVE